MRKLQSQGRILEQSQIHPQPQPSPENGNDRNRAEDAVRLVSSLCSNYQSIQEQSKVQHYIFTQSESALNPLHQDRNQFSPGILEIIVLAREYNLTLCHIVNILLTYCLEDHAKEYNPTLCHIVNILSTYCLEDHAKEYNPTLCHIVNILFRGSRKGV